MTSVYLDHNATTPLRPEVRERWLEALESGGRNASSLHGAGREARDRIDRARERVAAALGAHEDEIVFTASGTEANNLALQGALAVAGPDAALATTRIEHSSVLDTAAALERRGHPLRAIDVDAEGIPAAETVVRAARGAALVAVMAANNEIGSLAPLEEIGSGLADLQAADRPRLHVDAVQALGRIPIRLADWKADFASFSAHKIGGPLGVGVLWHRRGTPLAPVLFGGGQEGGLRPGTENFAAIDAAALAVELAVAEQPAYHARTSHLSAETWHALRTQLPTVRLLGPPIGSGKRLPNTLAILLEDVEGKVLVTRLDLEGLLVGAGSACASGSLEPSHVLLAMGHDEAHARNALRLSFGRDTTSDDVRRAVDILRKLFATSRAT